MEQFLNQPEPPHSIDAEQTVLGSVLIRPSIISSVLEKIKIDYFYTPQHKELFEIWYRFLPQVRKLI